MLFCRFLIVISGHQLVVFDVFLFDVVALFFS